MSQISLPFEWQGQGEEFLVSEANQLAVAHLERWRDWPVSVTVLTGPPLSGRSALGRQFVAMSGGSVIDDAEGQDEHMLFHAWNEAQTEHRPLLMIGRSGGGIRQVALAQQLGMEGPSLVRLLDKLCASDLVRRESDASDRRANLLWLTDAGHALVSELEDQLIGLRQDVFGELSMDELHAVLKAWRLLAEAADRIT